MHKFANKFIVEEKTKGVKEYYLLELWFKR